MKVLNLYFSSTGNTEKVARKISEAVEGMGHRVETLKVGSEDTEVDVLDFDTVFAGSGVYEWLPGKPVQDLFTKLRRDYVTRGFIKQGSPKIPDKKAVIYCTYGGVHTGINEAVPAVKYMAQLFDHLGFLILGEWYFVGEYRPEKMQSHSVGGRLGDIRGRPNDQDLNEADEMVKGILKV